MLLSQLIAAKEEYSINVFANHICFSEKQHGKIFGFAAYIKNKIKLGPYVTSPAETVIYMNTLCRRTCKPPLTL